MPTPWRLPTVGSDDGTWGNILNQFIALQHANTGADNSTTNGQHMNVSILKPSDSSGLPSSTQPPLKFTSDNLLATPIAGGMEFSTDKLTFTITTSTARRTIAFTEDFTQSFMLGGM